MAKREKKSRFVGDSFDDEFSVEDIVDGEPEDSGEDNAKEPKQP